MRTEAIGRADMTSMPTTFPASKDQVPLRVRAPFVHRLKQKGRLYLTLALLMTPTIGGMLLFTYYPQLGTILHSFERWDGHMIREPVGLRNFHKAFTGDPLFWHTFTLVLILFAANLVKMWPSIFTAIVLHRIRSDKWQYRYRVLFVLPMIIPGLVWLLIWKTFYEPSTGPLNKFLNATGLLAVLRAMDTAMPQLAGALEPLRRSTIDAAFNNVWGLAVFGMMVLSAGGGLRRLLANWMWWLVLLAAALWTWGDRPAYFAWALAAVVGVELVQRRMGLAWRDLPKWIGAGCLAAAALAVLLSMTWTAPTHAFDSPTPEWLARTQLVIPAMIFWGFPWVGTVGVLIYLSGLQSISQDVYEAAEIDGITSFGKLIYIELPLMLTQIRINLVFLTIGTLTDYGLILLLLGPEGGPNNVGLVPGLYMYREAFIRGEFGYACALGMVMFGIILFITIFYQKYIRVEK